MALIDFGKELKSRRQLKGWSLRAAADRLGVSHTHLHDLEKGAGGYPGGQTLCSFRRCYGISAKALLDLLEP